MMDKNWEARCLKAKKKRDKLRGMVEYLSERDLEAQGGYPYDCRWFGRTLVIAGLDEAKAYGVTKLELYKRKELLRWFDRARKFYKIAKGATGFDSSLYETARPRKKVAVKVRKEKIGIVK
jgi:hypothetical protein